MATNHWINDTKTIIGCEPPQLFKVLAKLAVEDSDRGLFARNSYTKILECMKDVKYFLGEIRRDAQDFTLHDLTHCINVIDFMGQMLVDVEKINPAEISFFIYSALLHDIGMVKLPEEDISLSEIREDHGDRSARFIRDRRISTNNGKQLDFGEWDEVYMEYLPLICASHMQEFSFVEKLPESIFIDDMEIDISLCAILLRLADAMDLKRNRAPYQLYQFVVNRSISEEHWKKHIAISSCRIDERGIYRVDGICHDEAVHRCLYNHLDMIESEIEKVFRWKNETHARLSLKIHLVHRNIKTDTYKMWNHSFSMDILKITNLFMGEQLYGDKKVGLREIIQNSIDACMIRDEINKSLGTNQDYTYKPEIYIIFDWNNNQLIIRDNGTGMNNYIIQNFFLNIGASYYSTRDFEKKNLKYNPSGYFGIGFLACFMLSDDVYVRTAHWQENMEYEFHFKKNDKFVTKTEKPKTFSGTEIRLNLDQVKQIFDISEINPDESIIEFIYTYFWNLRIYQKDNNTLLCSVQTNSFKEFAIEILEKESGYNIDISEYLQDVEGIIHLENSELFRTMKCLTKIKETNPLDAIKKGELSFSNKISDCLTFIKQFYTYNNDTGRIEEYKEDDKTEFFTFLFFPTDESIIKTHNLRRNETELEEEEIKEYFSLYNWNCLCLNKSGPEHDYKIRLRIKENVEHLDTEKDIFIKKLCDYIGYSPSCYIALTGLSNRDFNNVVFNNNNIDKYTGIYFLNQVRLLLYNNYTANFNLVYFEVEDIIINISNHHIIPDTARRYITSTPTVKLIEAIEICICLWLYDQIKNDKEANQTAEYLKQLILSRWKGFAKDLLKPEKKPV